MLANPVVVPAHATPEVWLLAFLAIWAEVRTEAGMLRRSGWGHDVGASLVLLNGMTWLLFLLAVDELAERGNGMFWGVTLLEVAVVVFEGGLIWSALKLRSRAGAGPSVSWLRALAVSTVGNLVSVSVSIVLPMAFLWLLVRLPNLAR